MPEHRDIRSSTLQNGGKLLRLIARNDWFSNAGSDKYRKLGEISHQIWRERNLRSEEHACRQGMRVEQDQTCSNIGAVRVAYRNQMPLTESLMLCGGIEELSQLIRAHLQILNIEDALGKSAEEPGHAVLQYLATDAQESGTGPRFSSKRQQVSLITACAVQQQQRRGRRSLGEHKNMHEV
jgi:hypothetical protein